MRIAVNLNLGDRRILILHHVLINVFQQINLRIIVSCVNSRLQRIVGLITNLRYSTFSSITTGQLLAFNPSVGAARSTPPPGTLSVAIATVGANATTIAAERALASTFLPAPHTVLLISITPFIYRGNSPRPSEPKTKKPCDPIRHKPASHKARRISPSSSQGTS